MNLSNPALSRRAFLGGTLAAGAALALEAGPAGTGGTLRLEEATLDELRLALEGRRTTSRDLAARYLARIESLDRRGPRLGSVIETNPDVFALAESLDREQAEGRSRGVLHGLPILVKDNLDTADRMKTTAGSLALVDAPAPARDAFVVQRLRESGALLLGKTNLSEWANFRSTRSISGWSGRGGQTRNPHALDRSPSGSSSGSAAAVAAGLCAGAIGTETDGSIVSPASSCGIVGLKPTLGLVSRSGIIPLAHSQDTAGPMTRTVRDAALLLGVLAGADPRDRATEEADRNLSRDYTRFLDADGLKGARLGFLADLRGRHPGVDRVMVEALAVLRRGGATVVEVSLSSRAYDAAELEVLLFEFKADLNAYLQARGGAVKDLAGLVAFNTAHEDQELPLFGQELLEQAQAKGTLADPAYLAALEACRAARRDLVALCDGQRLDALIGPTSGPAWLIDPVNGDSSSGLSASSFAAVGGCPHLTVPMGFVFGLPAGLSFFGRPWDEGRLLRLGYAYEQASRARRVPRFAPSATVPGLNGPRG